MITQKAYAKLNLCLQVGDVLPNGYHSVISLMDTVSLFDLVTVEKAERIQLECVGQNLSAGEDNLAHKAAVAFFKQSGIQGGASIRLEKHIPQAAGLGGGSADAAAVLRALNVLYGTGYDTKRLCAIAVPLGADVPFCVVGGSQIATGIGEQLSPARQNKLNMVLLFGNESLSTPFMYKSLDAVGNSYSQANEFIKLWQSGDVAGAFKYGGNSFYPIAAKLDSTVTQNVAKLKSEGAFFACISGKGPTVFGVFHTDREAKLAAKKLGGIAVNSVSFE